MFKSATFHALTMIRLFMLPSIQSIPVYGFLFHPTKITSWGKNVQEYGVTEEKDLMSNVNSPLLSSDLLFLHDTQQEELKNNSILLGLTDVTGPGMEIILKDNTNISSELLSINVP